MMFCQPQEPIREKLSYLGTTSTNSLVLNVWLGTPHWYACNSVLVQELLARLVLIPSDLQFTFVSFSAKHNNNLQLVLPGG